MTFRRYNVPVRRLALPLLGALAALVVLSGAGAGTFPGFNGLVAFGCGSGICTATDDGTVYGSPLISPGANPAWSASGARLAFQRGADIYTANADGTGQVLFKTGASAPTWAPDDTTIAFVESDGHIWQRDSSSSTESQLTSGTSVEADPSYSPDGTEIAYSSLANGDTDAHIWIKPLPSGAPAQITSGSTNDVAPSWSPDGSTIVYSADGELTAVSTTPPYTTTDLGVAGTDPSYSPDGTEISFVTATQKLEIYDTFFGTAQAVSAASSFASSDTDWGTASPPTSGSGGPTNTSYPRIILTSGDSGPVVGHTLVANVGSWSGTFPISYSYQWKRCDPADPVNGACVAISGATSSFYAPSADDYGKRLRVAVTATNSQGSTSQNSEVSAIVQALAAKNTATPQITPDGTNQVDQQLSLTAGTWTGSTPITYTYSWRRCNPVGDLASCVPITGATASTYTPTVADIGSALRVWITGTNLAGSDTTITNHTYPIVDKPHFAPSIGVAASITGATFPGRQLTGSVGTFVGDPPIATSFRWFRCDATGQACHAIRRATTIVYHPVAADVGSTLRLFVSASNAYGKLTELSDPTGAIAATPPHVRGRRIVDTNRGHYLAGGGHDDVIFGRGGNDTILGGAGDDRLYGGPGNDVITGGSGADRIYAGPGSDTIDVADGERDVVDCGAGNDHVIADAVDIVRKNCEVVTPK